MKFSIQMAVFGLTLIAFVATGMLAPETAMAFGIAGAVVSVKSTVITNLEATPSVLNKAYMARGRIHHGGGIVTAANGDSIGSTYRVCRIKSNDFVKRVELVNASWGAACTADFGLYDTAGNGGAVVDADFFASAVDMNTARAAPLDVTLEAGAAGGLLTNREKRVWEALGLAADPQREYELTLTLVAAAAAAGSAFVSVETVPSAG